MNEIQKLKKKKRLEKVYNYIYFIFIIVLFSVIGYFVINDAIYSYKPDESLIEEYDLSKDLIPTPIQKKIDSEKIITKINGVNVTIEKLAKYDITGKVEATKEYSTSALASKLSFSSRGSTVINMISPRDITLSWGKIALEENSGHIYCDQYEAGNRIVRIKPDGYLIDKYGENKVYSQVSNNHVITLDKGLKNELKKIKQDQIVRIVGYLVYVKCDDGTTWGPSSMSRTDTGLHACEILLAEEIVKMERK